MTHQSSPYACWRSKAAPAAGGKPQTEAVAVQKQHSPHMSAAWPHTVLQQSQLNFRNHELARTVSDCVATASTKRASFYAYMLLATYTYHAMLLQMQQATTQRYTARCVVVTPMERLNSNALVAITYEACGLCGGLQMRPRTHSNPKTGAPRKEGLKVQGYPIRRSTSLATPDKAYLNIIDNGSPHNTHFGITRPTMYHAHAG